jgi:membrane protease YdiL (CAAX protease family)
VSLGGELVGYVLLALASVGFMLRRDLRATLQRLGVRPISPVQLATVAIGVTALYALNAGAEWLERVFFNDLWNRDQRFTEIIASGLGPVRVLLLGLSAGIGEEITLRGALQPKLGLVTTSLLFAVLHVQYSWFGIGVIFLLGLTLGTIRMKTSTSVAMAVHTIYDVLAVFSV